MSAWLTAVVARLTAAFCATTVVRSGSSTRIQPTRSPPHSSFDTEPNAITLVLSAASGGGDGASRVRSASVRSSMTATLPASAIAAMD